MSYQTLKCENCGNSFVWSEEEMELYNRRGLPSPKYCPICRGIIDARSRDSNRARMENSRKSNIDKDLDER